MHGKIRTRSGQEHARQDQGKTKQKQCKSRPELEHTRKTKARPRQRPTRDKAKTLSKGAPPMSFGGWKYNHHVESLVWRLKVMMSCWGRPITRHNIVYTQLLDFIRTKQLAVRQWTLNEMSKPCYHDYSAKLQQLQLKTATHSHIKSQWHSVNHWLCHFRKQLAPLPDCRPLCMYTF